MRNKWIFYIWSDGLRIGEYGIWETNGIPEAPPPYKILHPRDPNYNTSDNSAWGLPNADIRLITFARRLSSAILNLGTFAWDFWLRNFHVGCFAFELSLGIFRLGTLADGLLVFRHGTVA